MYFHIEYCFGPENLIYIPANMFAGAECGVVRGYLRPANLAWASEGKPRQSCHCPATRHLSYIPRSAAAAAATAAVEAEAAATTTAATSKESKDIDRETTSGQLLYRFS